VKTEDQSISITQSISQSIKVKIRATLVPKGHNKGG